jgi:hypothetical protein
MARTTNGIIPRKVCCQEIIDVIGRYYKDVKDDGKATDDFAVLEFKAGRYAHDLRITMNAKLYENEKSGKEYGMKLPDEVTFLAMTHTEDCPKIMRNIISQFGGYVQDDDCSDYYDVGQGGGLT